MTEPDLALRVYCSVACRDGDAEAMASAPSAAHTVERAKSASASWSTSSEPGFARLRKKRDASWTGDHASLADPLPLAPPPTLALGLACAAI
ncbi:MAG: hypothetical protein J0L92_33740, partial [Deltaproteobacteria bacterium]|nr:hypothetical protein [Deltaproteobacteria bacterium]